MPLNTAGVNALPRELGSHGSAVNNTVRQLAGAIGTAVVITVYIRFKQLHMLHSYLWKMKTFQLSILWN
jgi:hypothetical protein